MKKVKLYDNNGKEIKYATFEGKVYTGTAWPKDALRKISELDEECQVREGEGFAEWSH